MPDTVLVGVDDHGEARDAVAFGAALATALGGELAIAHVYPFDPLARSLALGGSPADPLEVEAREIVDRAAADCPMPYRPIVASHPSTVGGLHEQAARTGAALLVVGSSRRGPVGRIALGSHSERVLVGAPCAVAVAPHGMADAGWEPKRIAVAYDGSEDAGVAVGTARSLAAATGATLQLITVIESAPGGWERYTYQPDWRAEEHRMRRSAEEALAATAAAGEETDVRIGDAVEQLLMLCHTADLLVLGSRGYGPVRRVFEGATSHRVVREAACPVIVVPRSAGQDPTAPEGLGETATTT
jgi:nucleotide-binding universal stress UspA family protein